MWYKKCKKVRMFLIWYFWKKWKEIEGEWQWVAKLALCHWMWVVTVPSSLKHLLRVSMSPWIYEIHWFYHSQIPFVGNVDSLLEMMKSIFPWLGNVVFFFFFLFKTTRMPIPYLSDFICIFYWICTQSFYG
jgi:hypothetical protein